MSGESITPNYDISESNLKLRRRMNISIGGREGGVAAGGIRKRIIQMVMRDPVVGICSREVQRH